MIDSNEWVSQTNWNENIASILVTFCKRYDINISKQTIFSKYTGAEKMANFTVIEEFADDWGLQKIGLTFVKEHLDQQFMPAFVLMKGYRTVLLIEIKGETVCFIDGLKGYMEESKEVFFERSMGNIILVETDIHPKEDGFEEKEEEEKQRIAALRESFGIRVVDNFLTNEECEKLIALGDGLFSRSKVVAVNLNDAPTESDARTSSSAYLMQKSSFLDEIRERGAQLIKVDKKHFENVQLTSYTKGQQYEVHTDAFNSTDPDALKEGQRTHTILIYLNDDYEGGGTLFPQLDLTVKATTGKAVVWSSLLDDGEIDLLGYHGGLPVQNGRKYVCNLWVKDKLQDNWD